MRGTVPSPRETLQRTNNSLDDLYFNDWSSLLPWNASLLFDTRFESEKIENKPRSHDSHVDFDGLAGSFALAKLEKCRHTVCREGARLDNVHGCGRPSGQNSSSRKNLRLWP